MYVFLKKLYILMYSYKASQKGLGNTFFRKSMVFFLLFNDLEQ